MDAMTRFTDLPLETTDSQGRPVKSRIKDVKAAAEIFQALRTADEGNAVNRARVQAMFDGSPPYSEAQLRATGQAFRTNLNFGEGEAFLETAMAAYVDLVNSVDPLVSVTTQTGEEGSQKEQSAIVSEEVSRIIRKWPRFNYEYLNLCNNFVAHGVGIAYFETELDWRWKSTGLGDFLIPRQTPANEQDIEVAVARRTMPVHHLMRLISDETAAEKAGWNLKEVRKAIQQACASTDFDNWEKIQREIKNNDLYTGGKADRVKLLHFWVQELDGSVSHLISLESGENSDFLFKHIGRYKRIEEAFTFFTYGVGTNGTYHGIRGLGYKIYPHIQISNRLRSQMTDSAMLSSSLMLQPQDERALENFAFSYFGPFAVLPPNMNYVERNIPNLGNAAVPVLQQLDRQLQVRTGNYTPSSVFQSSKERTRFEVAAELEHVSKLSITSLNLFYEPFDRLIREMVRRLTNPSYPSAAPGYDLVKELRDRCAKRGIDKEVLGDLDHAKTKVVRSVGNGSQAQRQVALQRLNELAGAYDEEGRRNLFRDQTVSVVGVDAADRYIPRTEARRLTDVAKIAQLENNQLEEGDPVEVFSGELHGTHIQQHLPALQRHFDAVEAGEEPIEEAVLKMLGIYEHTVAHVEYFSDDPNVSDEAAFYRQALQQMGEIIHNGLKKVQAMQRDGQLQGGVGQEEGGEGLDQKALHQMEIELAKFRQKLEFAEESHRQKMLHKLQEQQQKLAFKDAERAKDIEKAGL